MDLFCDPGYQRDRQACRTVMADERIVADRSETHASGGRYSSALTRRTTYTLRDPAPVRSRPRSPAASHRIPRHRPADDQSPARRSCAGFGRRPFRCAAHAGRAVLTRVVCPAPAKKHRDSSLGTRLHRSSCRFLAPGGPLAADGRIPTIQNELRRASSASPPTSGVQRARTSRSIKTE
jgi:hypothetical protein